MEYVIDFDYKNVHHSFSTKEDQCFVGDEGDVILGDFAATLVWSYLREQNIIDTDENNRRIYPHNICMNFTTNHKNVTYQEKICVQAEEIMLHNE